MPMDPIESIKQLKARYFRTMDSKDWAGMRRVLSDDVVIDTTASGGGVTTGADAFIEMLQQTLGGEPSLGCRRRRRAAGPHAEGRSRGACGESWSRTQAAK